MSSKLTKAELAAELARTKAALARDRTALEHERREADRFARRVVELNKQIKGGAR